MDKSLMVKDSMTSVWIKIISSWLCFAMYALVMLLPPMCPDRNFGPAARAEEMAGAQTPACSPVVPSRPFCPCCSHSHTRSGVCDPFLRNAAVSQGDAPGDAFHRPLTH